MEDSGSIREIVNQAAVQAARVVVKAFRDIETESQPAPTQNQCEIQRQSNRGLILEKPRFNWDTLDRFVKLLNLT